ncbi:MAG: DUF547 domain-containing protein [Cyclobacteriaceae bacterium]|nr:DUF547 domain-containing protein [Cyclobacteriaceae bacterium]
MRISAALFLLFVLTGCPSLNPRQEGTFPVSHAAFSTILASHVDSQGYVDYLGLKNDLPVLTAYLHELSDNPPNDQNWSREDKMAYWINAYNAFTLQLILDHYPIGSIKDIGQNIQVPLLNTPWDLPFVRIGKECYTLNDIEHRILRSNFDEPRIHFAINCASLSCPKLRTEAYEATTLENQLNDQAEEFINDPIRNDITKEKARLSSIFLWFGRDFEKGQTKIEFINQYSRISISKKTEIEYLAYDWRLNEKSLK